MGTQQSSKGSPGNVPMVPPWVPDVPAPPPTPVPGTAPAETVPPGEPSAPALPAAPTPPQRVPMAPAGRFFAARRSAGSYARNGSTRDLKRALGHYVRTGYGGAKTAVRRFGGTANTAGALYTALSPSQPGAGPETVNQLDRTLLSGRSANEIMDAIVEAVRPVDGTQDAEANRFAIRNALSELLVRFPEADLLAPTEEQRIYAIERFAAIDVFQRFWLDLGKAIQDKAPSARAASSRLKEAKDYVKEVVSASFRRLRDAGQVFARGRIAGVVQAALLEALQVFEHYAE